MGTRRARAGGPARRWLTTAAVPAGVLLSALLVWQSSEAAFTASTPSVGNSWSSGTLDLTDDDSGSALFSVANLRPGKTGANCITVTYTGTVGSSVNMFLAPGDLAPAASSASSIAPYLNISIDVGTGGGFGNCGGFSGGVNAYTGTLADFAANKTNSATGVGSFTRLTGGTASRTYRITYTLADNDAAQATRAVAKFTWQATSN